MLWEKHSSDLVVFLRAAETEDRTFCCDIFKFSHSVYQNVVPDNNERHADRIEYVIDGMTVLAGSPPS